MTAWCTKSYHIVRFELWIVQVWLLWLTLCLSMIIYYWTCWNWPSDTLESRCSTMCKVGVSLYKLHCWQLNLLFPYVKLLNLKVWTKKLSLNSEMTVQMNLRPEIQASLTFDLEFGESSCSKFWDHGTAEIWGLCPNFMKYLQKMIL